MKLCTFFILHLICSLALANEASSPTDLEKSFAAGKDVFSDEVQPVLENIICDGNKKTKCSLIKKEVYLKIGKRIKEKELENAKIRLQLMGLFNKVEFKLEKGSTRGKVNLRIKVEEGSSYYSVTGVATGADFKKVENVIRDDVDGEIQLTLGNRNLFGLGKNISATFSSTSYDDFKIIDSTFFLRYTDPNLFNSKKWFLNTDLILQRDHRRDLIITNEYMAGFEIGRRVFDFSYVTVGYSMSHKEIDRIFGDETADASFMNFAYGYNSQDDQYFPTRGSRLDLRFSYLVSGRNVGNFNEFEITDADWRYTFSAGRKKYITLFAEGRNTFDSDELLNSGLGFEYGYQKKRNQIENQITDLRYYVGSALLGYSRFDEARFRIASGVKLRSKNFGLVRLHLYGDL